MNPQDTIDQFFIEDGQTLPDGKIKRSVLLALIEDMKYAVQLPGKWRELGHTPEQKEHMQTMLPSFTVASLFCTGIDVLAKVTQKRTAPRGQNRTFFTQCSMDWFHFSQEEADKLWELRNSIVHSYKLPTGSVLEQFGSGSVAKQFPSGIWHFYLHAMYTTFIKTSKEVCKHLSNEQGTDKQDTENYLTDNGFFYTLVPRN